MAHVQELNDLRYVSSLVDRLFELRAKLITIAHSPAGAGTLRSLAFEALREDDGAAASASDRLEHRVTEQLNGR